MWCATVRRQHRLPITGPTIGSFTVTPSSTVRDLGVRLHRLGYVDAGPVRDASLLYASCVPSGGRYQLQCSSRLFLLHSSFLDWTMFGLPVNLITRLQSVQNAATRLIFRIRRSEHNNTPALISLHWLRVPERISFKLAVLTYPSLYGTSPSYLQSCFTRVADNLDDVCGLLPLIV